MLPGMRAPWSSVLLFALGAGSGCAGDDEGGGSGGSSGAGGGGGAAGAGGGGAVTCASYCDAIMSACTGASAQYGSKDTCLASCSAFPAGAAGEKTGHSLACRAYHADTAATDGVSHCAHAGPAGDGMCGGNCEGYCSLMLKHCPSAYASEAECTSQCPGITSATASGYDTGEKTGDSLFCRIYHATAASTDPTTHCVHAQLNPTAVCL